MSAFQQILCTHCTYGTSALERGGAETAHVVFGYTARAGSEEGRPLADAYRQLDGLLGYKLPAGTTEDDKLRTRPEDAPRAFLVLPQVGTLQAFGQVAHRQTDSTGRRAGSYFAHLLYRPAGAPGWTAREALALYAAPGWTMHDRPDLPHPMPAVADPAALGRGQPAAVSDRLVEAFLKDGPANWPNDPAGLVPARWRAKPAEERRALVATMIDAALATGGREGRTVALLAEPGFAAFLFYAALRLLPPNTVAAAASVNTYDSEPGRRRTTFLATWAHAGAAGGDLPEELYDAGRGFGLNTVTGRSTPAARAGQYAAQIVRTAAQQWAAADAALADLSRRGAKTADDLERVTAANLLVKRLWEPGPMPPVWQDSPLAAAVLAEALVGPQRATPERAKTDAAVRAADILSRARTPEADAALKDLLAAAARGPHLNQFIKLQKLPDDAKFDLLCTAVGTHGKLPAEAADYWQGKGVLKRLAPRLAPGVIDQVAASVPPKLKLAWVCALAAAPAHKAKGVAALDAWAMEMDDDDFARAVVDADADVWAAMTDSEEVVVRTARLLDNLPDHLDEAATGGAAIDKRVRDGIDTRLTAVDRFDAAAMGEDRKLSVAGYRDAIKVLLKLEPEGGGTQAEAIELGKAFRRAVSDDYDRKIVVRNLATAVRGTTRMFKKSEWADVDTVLAGGRPTIRQSAQPAKRAKGSGGVGKQWSAMVGGVARLFTSSDDDDDDDADDVKSSPGKRKSAKGGRLFGLQPGVLAVALAGLASAGLVCGLFVFVMLGDKSKAVADNDPKTNWRDSTTTNKAAAEKLAAEKLAAEKLAAEKLAAEKLAAEKLAAEKLAAEKLAAEKLAAEKLAAEKLAAEKLAAEKLAAEKLAAEKATADATRVVDVIREVRTGLTKAEEKITAATKALSAAQQWKNEPEAQVKQTIAANLKATQWPDSPPGTSSEPAEVKVRIPCLGVMRPFVRQRVLDASGQPVLGSNKQPLPDRLGRMELRLDGVENADVYSVDMTDATGSGTAPAELKLVSLGGPKLKPPDPRRVTLLLKFESVVEVAGKKKDSFELAVPCSEPVVGGQKFVVVSPKRADVESEIANALAAWYSRETNVATAVTAHRSATDERDKYRGKAITRLSKLKAQVEQTRQVVSNRLKERLGKPAAWTAVCGSARNHDDAELRGIILGHTALLGAAHQFFAKTNLTVNVSYVSPDSTVEAAGPRSLTPKQENVVVNFPKEAGRAKCVIGLRWQVGQGFLDGPSVILEGPIEQSKLYKIQGNFDGQVVADFEELHKIDGQLGEVKKLHKELQQHGDGE